MRKPRGCEWIGVVETNGSYMILIPTVAIRVYKIFSNTQQWIIVQPKIEQRAWKEDVSLSRVDVRHKTSIELIRRYWTLFGVVLTRNKCNHPDKAQSTKVMKYMCRRHETQTNSFSTYPTMTYLYLPPSKY